MDEFSDLDFFAIVQQGYKRLFLDDLSWLSDIAPIGYSFQNTADGYKLLYTDGVFCEFAVFEPQELANIPFTEGRVIWSADEFDPVQLTPGNGSGRYQHSSETDWLIGEALTNLLVGLSRFHRGEKLSAFKFVQSFAADRLIDLAHQVYGQRSGDIDPFMPERRLEEHYPALEKHLQAFCQGYLHTPQSALTQLNWLEAYFNINPSIAAEIRKLT